MNTSIKSIDYTNQLVLFSDLRNSISRKIAACLCNSNVRDYVMSEVESCLENSSDPTKLVLSYTKKFQVIRTSSSNRDDAMNQLRLMVRSARSAMKASNDLPLFDEELFNRMTLQVRRVQLHPDFSMRLMTMADVLFTQQLDDAHMLYQSTYMISKHKKARRLAGEVTNPALPSKYMGCLAAITFTQAEVRSARTLKSLIEINDPLVRSQAKAHANNGVDFDTLYSAGCFGLIRAAQRFNPDLGFKFSTTALPWIKQMILEEFQKDMTVALPYRLGPKLNRINKILGNDPSATTQQIAEKVKMKPKDVDKLRAEYSNVSSLDSAVTTDDGAGDMYAFMGTDDYSPEESCSEMELQGTIEKLLAENLNADEQIVIRTAMGLDGGLDTLKQLTEEHGIPREQVRRLKLNAMNKLKEVLGDACLSDFLLAS